MTYWLIHIIMFLLMISVLSVLRGFGAVSTQLSASTGITKLGMFMLIPAIYQIGHIVTGSLASVWIDCNHRKSLLLGAVLSFLGFTLSALFTEHFFILLGCFVLASIGTEFIAHGAWSVSIKTKGTGRTWDVLSLSTASSISPIVFGLVTLLFMKYGGVSSVFVTLAICLLFLSVLLYIITKDIPYKKHIETKSWKQELIELIKQRGFRKVAIYTAFTYGSATLIAVSFAFVFSKMGLPIIASIPIFILWFCLISFIFRFIWAGIGYYISVRLTMILSAILGAIGLVLFPMGETLAKVGLILVALCVSAGQGSIYVYVADRWGQENLYTVMGHLRTFNGIITFIILIIFGILFDLTGTHKYMFWSYGVILFLGTLYFAFEKDIMYKNKLNGRGRNGNN